MANLRSPRYQFICFMQFLMLLQSQVFCYQYKVGDLDAWGIPTSANPHIYTNWPKNHNFKIGDSLLFLYPPSQDSVIQVTEQSFNACNLKDPILYMNNGNSLFNVTTLGEFYFTSGEEGHCGKKQRIQISVLSGNGSAGSPSYGPTASSLPETSPSYNPVFGTIPAPPSSSPTHSSSVFVAALIGFAAYTLIISGSM